MMLKKIILIILAIAAIGLIGIWLFLNTNIFKDDNENPDKQTNVEAISANQDSNEYVFVGDEAYLVKGKLTDDNFRDVYEKLPDTLYQLEFDDRIFSMEKDVDVNNMSFSLVQKNTLKNLVGFNGTGEQENLINYLKLVANGKATFPKIASPENSYQSLIKNDEFQTKYADYFVETVDNYGMSNLPSGVKLKLIDFFNSKEGKNYRYKLKGNQTSADMIWSGELTGRNKKEIAILLNNTESNLGDRYLLLVYALPSDGRDQQYYLVYDEVFYDKVLMEHLKSSADGENYSEDIYMNTQTKMATPFDGILLKQINYPDYALVYDRSFDKLVKYIQQPKSNDE